MGQDMDVINGTFGGTASAWGANLWIIVAIVASFAIMSFGIAGGIEKANKVMMPVLFALFLALGVYIFTLGGSSDGYKYILTINPKGLADPKLWIYAFGQAFFSLSVAGNGSVIYGSYLSREECIDYGSDDCLRRLSSSRLWRPAALSSTPAAPDLCSSSS